MGASAAYTVPASFTRNAPTCGGGARGNETCARTRMRGRPEAWDNTHELPVANDIIISIVTHSGGGLGGQGRGGGGPEQGTTHARTAGQRQGHALIRLTLFQPDLALGSRVGPSASASLQRGRGRDGSLLDVHAGVGGSVWVGVSVRVRGGGGCLPWPDVGRGSSCGSGC